MRPGVAPAVHRLDAMAARIESLDREARDRADRLQAAVNRVTGDILDKEKYRGELAYWRWLLTTDEGRASLFAPFEEAFGQWQRDRLRELIPILGLDREGDGEAGLDEWCGERSVVEIGGGPFPAVAAAHWRRAVVVDPLTMAYADEGLIADACREVVYIDAPGERVPLPAGFADLVIIENALDHVTDPAAVLAECHRLLAAGGLLWLLVDLMTYTDAMHPHGFNEAKLRELVTLSGFAVVSDRTSGHKSHPKASGEYRGLLRRREIDAAARHPVPAAVPVARGLAPVQLAENGETRARGAGPASIRSLST